MAANYAYALALFGALFLLRERVRETRALDALAAISFPMYLVHALVGWSLLRLLMLAGGLGYAAALAVTVAAVLALATLLHAVVERPSLALGKRLAAPRPLRAGNREPTQVAAPSVDRRGPAPRAGCPPPNGT